MALFRLEQGEEIPGLFFATPTGDSTGATRAGPDNVLASPLPKIGIARMSAFGGIARMSAFGGKEDTCVDPGPRPCPAWLRPTIRGMASPLHVMHDFVMTRSMSST
jgi:hypothetical protein